MATGQAFEPAAARMGWRFTENGGGCRNSTRGGTMIARIWRGITLAEKADAYVDYLNETGLRDYAKTPGNSGVTVLRRLQGDHCEIVLISLWDSMAAVRAFAGENPERSVYYPEDEHYLLEMEPLVRHYEVADQIMPGDVAPAAAPIARAKR
jgi:heme-degrading monooxygenase HmoA